MLVDTMIQELLHKKEGRAYLYYLNIDYKNNDSNLMQTYYISSEDVNGIKEAISEVQSFLFEYLNNKDKKIFLSFIDPIKGNSIRSLIEKPKENVDLINTLLLIKKLLYLIFI